MQRRGWALSVLIVFSIVVAGLVPAAAAQPQPRALVRIPLAHESDRGLVEASGIPVYAHLAAGKSAYLLAGATPGEVAALAAQGLEVTVLDADVGEAARSATGYYLAHAAPGRPAPDWPAYGRLLLDDGQQVLLRTSPAAAEQLAGSGAELWAVSLTPKPWPQVPVREGAPDLIVPDPLIQAMIDQVDGSAVYNYTAGLSGVWPVTIGGLPYTIRTRNSNSGEPVQKATQFAGEHLGDLGLDVEYQTWSASMPPNVIGELPGLIRPDQIFIIGAHLDDMPSGALAPGADDNGSGSVATLIAADILSQYDWGCTLRFALWTGEEQGLLGSQAYAARSAGLGEDIGGYLNLDMIAWNTAASQPGIDLVYNPNMPATQQLAQLFADVVGTYGLVLTPQLLTSLGGGSDHQSFWQQGYTSILAIEDQGDFNPNYHTTADTLANLQDLAYYTQFVKAAVGTMAHMSGCLIPSGIGHLQGNVTTDGGSTPVEGATVTMTGADGQSLHTSTDACGYYTQTLLSGTYTVTAEAYGYLPATVGGVVVVTDSTTTQDLILDKAPTYVVSGTVVETGSSTPLLAELEVAGTPLVATTDANGHYELAVAEGSYTLIASAARHQTQERAIVVSGDQTQDFALEPLPCLLLVDDDNNSPDVRPFYTAALDHLGYAYDVFDAGNGSGPSLAGLQGYPQVIWFTGDKYGGSAGPSSGDEMDLATYLDGGGHLFLSSQDYLYDMGLTSFGQSYLGIGTYTSDTGDATTKYGLAGDPIGNGLGPYPLSYPAGFTDYGDIVNAGSGASVAFRSSATGGNNLDVDKDGGAWQTVFFGTSWVPIYNASAANGEQVLQRIVDTFGGCACDPVQDLGFSWAPPEPEAGQTVYLTATGSSTLPMALGWDLGDGTQADGAQIEHIFEAAGTYTVTLRATNACGSEVITHSLTVQPGVCEPVRDVQFGWLPPEPEAGETVHLTATAAGSPPMAFDWDLGDGSTDTGTDIEHVYVSTGTYTVALTASNACGVETISHTLTVEPPECQGVEIVTTTTEISGCVVTFGAELQGTPPFAYHWDMCSFGSSTAPTVTVDFRHSGSYGYTLGVGNCVDAYEAVQGMVEVACVPSVWHYYLPLIVRGE